MAPDPYEIYSSNGWTSFIQQFGGHRILCQLFKSVSLWIKSFSHYWIRIDMVDLIHHYAWMIAIVLKIHCLLGNFWIYSKWFFQVKFLIYSINFIVLETLTKLPCPSFFAFFNFTNCFTIEWLNWRIWILLFFFCKFSFSFDLILRRDNQIFNFFCLNFKHDFEFFIFHCCASILQI